MKRYYKGENRYEDILSLPHFQSKKHPHMPISDRASQFAPFAALSGHEAAIKETEQRAIQRQQVIYADKNEMQES